MTECQLSFHQIYLSSSHHISSRTTNEELSDVSSFKQRGKNLQKKQQILASLYAPRFVSLSVFVWIFYVWTCVKMFPCDCLWEQIVTIGYQSWEIVYYLSSMAKTVSGDVRDHVVGDSSLSALVFHILFLSLRKSNFSGVMRDQIESFSVSLNTSLMQSSYSD